MRTFDFAPLSRSTIGFDRLFDLLNTNSELEGQPEYPPYDITRSGEDTYRITLALAGFAPDEIAVTAQQNLLIVAGQKTEATNHQYLHRGIAARPFERRFSLEDHVEVEGATFDNGLLQIDLVRKLPEAMKSRRIEIGTGKPSSNLAKGKTVEQVRQVS
jgi:molecular chaperone IbpA